MITKKIISNAPTKDYKGYKDLCTALSLSLCEKRNKNIGLIGDYGSGKSSAINTFIRRDKLRTPLFRRHVVKISLAEYCETSNTMVESLEQCIIQQLMHSVSRFRIPDSKFITKGFRFRSFLMWLSLFLCVFFTVATLETDLFPFLDFFGKYLFLIPIALGFFFVLFLFKSVRIKNIHAKFDNAEVSAEFDYEDPFDKNILELLYFFKKTHKNLVIFEDIDRCKNCDELFVKLRNLNFVLNNAPFARCIFRRQIVFLHAIKEGIFENNEQRSKYFDVLIPIKPILTSTNKKERLKSLLGKDTNRLSKAFIDTISISFDYIREMQNVINSFRILSTDYMDEKDCDSLFSFLLYKNLFFDDYLNAIKDKGILIYLLKAKTTPVNFVNYCLATNSYKAKYKTSKFVNGKLTEIAYSTADYDSIKQFYDKTKTYLDVNTLGFLSSFPNGGLSTRDRNFINKLIAGKGVKTVTYEIDNPQNIVEIEDIENKITLDILCNLDVFDFINGNNKYSSLYNLFVGQFKIETKRRNEFVRECIDRISKGNFSYCVFLQQISEYYPVFKCLLSMKLKNKVIFDIISRIFVYDKIIAFQNSNNELVNFLNENNDTLKYILKYNESLFNSLIGLPGFKIKKFFVKSRYSKSDKNKLILIFKTMLFSVSKETVSFIYELLGKNSIKKPFSALMDLSEGLAKTVFGYEDIQKLFNFKLDFSLEDSSFLKNLLPILTEASLKTILLTCNVVDFEKTMIESTKNFSLLISCNKVCGTISDFASIPDSIVNKVEYIIRNIELLKDGEPFDEQSKNLLKSILNDDRCTDDIATKIIEHLKLKDGKLKVEVFNTSNSFPLLLEYKCYPFDNNLVNKLSTSQLVLKFASKYKEEILNIGNVSFNEAQILLLYEYFTNNDLLLFVNLYVSSILPYSNKINLEKLYEFSSKLDQKYQALILSKMRSFDAKDIEFYLKSVVSNKKQIVQNVIIAIISSNGAFQIESNNQNIEFAKEIKTSGILTYTHGTKNIKFKLDY